MNLPEKWIWLSDKLYPDNQTTNICGFFPQINYTVAEFKKEYSFNQKIKEVFLRFSGDTAFEIYLNENLVSTGPVPVGGDFLNNDIPRGEHFATEVTLYPDSEILSFYSRVKMSPVGIYEYSKGHGGFMLSARVSFEDGTQTVITTDETWLCRKNGSYVSPLNFDGRIQPDEFSFAQVTQNLWHCETAPLSPLSENVITSPVGEITVNPGEKKDIVIEYDKIYAAILALKVKTKGELSVKAIAYELEIDGREKTENFVFVNDADYRGLQVLSIGEIKLEIENKSNAVATVLPEIITVCYPVYQEAKTETSDDEVNLILDVCAHTLKYCRQHIHIDSPCHYEPLACTGDYYIESLMTAFSFGDMDLAKFDIIRTANLIRNNNGRMFHTTYSLIWVMMLYDVYEFTADKKLLSECKDALIMLLRLFETYVGDNGVIENPPDYMFIDWLYIDEISLHHPPKALGQTCINMFYYGALKKGELVFSLLGDKAMANYCVDKAKALQKSVNTVLFDTEKQMYFEGLNTLDAEDLINDNHPQNVSKRYYRKHANILAAYVGICDKDMCVDLLHRIMSDEIEGDYQAYFAHYLLEAIYKNGLREEYTLKVIDRWRPIVKECSKGLAEGLIPPEPTYSFDHSHAWGGTALYSLPLALTGFEMVKAGFEEIKLNPSILSFENAQVQMPTPYGNIVVKLKKGEKPQCTVPKEITLKS